VLPGREHRAAPPELHVHHDITTFLAATTLGLVTACTGNPQATPEPAAATPAASSPPATTTPSTADAPAKATPAPRPTGPTKAATVPVSGLPSPALRVVAVRDSPFSLRAAGGMPVLGLEGEPVPLVDGAFTRVPNAGTGLPECADDSYVRCRMIGYAGAMDGPLGAWVTIQEDVERVGEIVTSFHRKNDRWVQVPAPSDMLVGSYDVLVERERTVFGFPGWRPHPSGELWVGEPMMEGETHPTSKRWGSSPKAYVARRNKAVRKAERRWVQLAGAPVTPLETLPKQIVHEAVSTADGTIYALTSAGGLKINPESEVWDLSYPGPQQLVVWRPGTTKLETVAVPDLERAGVSLAAGNDWVLLHGRIPISEDEHEIYLAVTKGNEWERVPLRVPGRSSETSQVLGAAKAPDGSLWVALGTGWLEEDYVDAQPLWHKPVEGEWQPVALPPSDEAPPADPPATLAPNGMAHELVGGAGAIWATLLQGNRMVVVTTLAGSGPAVVLPSPQQIEGEGTRVPSPPMTEDEPW
jgi:hypothetical protein